MPGLRRGSGVPLPASIGDEDALPSWLPHDFTPARVERPPGVRAKPPLDTPPDMAVTISDLRDCSRFFDMVADRIWRAWWEPNGVRLDAIVRRLRENLGPGPLPTALVAHHGEVFVGTASVIASDLDARPQYTPWIAAVWIEPQFRSQRIGRLLVEHATQLAFDTGATQVYLAARPHRQSYYEELGWTVIEQNVGDNDLTIFVKAAVI